MELTNATPIQIGQGKYNLRIKSTTGDAKLQYQISDEGYGDIADAVFTGATDIGITADLPSCSIQAIITGDAVVYLNLAG